MNRYGRQAIQHWTQVDPERVAAIAEPEAFFTQLGEEVMQQIDVRARALEGHDPPSESYLEKVARLNMARFTAEGEVLREMVLIPTPDQAGEGEEKRSEAMAEWFARRRRERQEEQDELDAETTRDHRLPE
jgi:hypothetical protein